MSDFLWFSPVELLQKTSIVQDSEAFWWMTCLWFPWSSKGCKLFLPSFLTKTSLGSDYIFVVSLAADNLYAGFAFPHHFSIIWFSSLYQSLYAIPQQPCSWHSLCSRAEEPYILCITAFGLRNSSWGSSPVFVSRFWSTRPVLSLPEYCKHYTVCTALVPRECERMEACELLPFKAMYPLLAKGCNVVAKDAQNMVIRKKFYIALIIEEACRTWSNEVFRVFWGGWMFLFVRLCLFFFFFSALRAQSRMVIFWNLDWNRAAWKKTALNLKGTSAFKRIAELCSLTKYAYSHTSVKKDS